MIRACPSIRVTSSRRLAESRGSSAKMKKSSCAARTFSWATGTARNSRPEGRGTVRRLMDAIKGTHGERAVGGRVDDARKSFPLAWAWVQARPPVRTARLHRAPPGSGHPLLRSGVHLTLLCRCEAHTRVLIEN